MRQEKIIFIIPGFGHKPTNIGYRKLARFLKSEGYYPIPVAIPWKSSTISENIEFFLKVYKKHLAKIGPSRKHIYFLGFSFGAIIAFWAATKISITGLFLCSLSPFFKEDLPKTVSRNATNLQKKRYTNFSKLHSGEIAKQVKAKKVMMLYGAKESKTLIHRMSTTFDKIASKEKYLFSIQKAEHNIGDTKYFSAIRRIAISFL